MISTLLLLLGVVLIVRAVVLAHTDNAWCGFMLGVLSIVCGIANLFTS